MVCGERDPPPVTLELNKHYVREILARPIGLRTDGFNYVSDGEDHRSQAHREIIDAGGAPSELVIEQKRATNGHEYRDETEGPNPVPWPQATR